MLRALIPLFLASLTFAQSNPAWTRSIAPFKVAGNLYYVGTEDLACYLFATPRGHILINTGLADSTPLIRASMKQLGYKLEDIKILLIMQAHFDHTAAMAEIQKLSGAKVYVTEADAKSMEDGAHSDPSFGPSSWFTPVHVDRRLKDGDTVSLGGTDLKVILTPGHTKGSVSYSTTLEDAGKKRSVLIVNLNSVVMPLVNNSYYPNIVDDYRKTFEKQKKLSPEIWVAGHASQFDMAAKAKAGSFADPQGYKDAVLRYEKMFDETLAKEQKQSKGSTR